MRNADSAFDYCPRYVRNIINSLAVLALFFAGTARADIFEFSYYATVSPAEDWSFVGGQFAGDSRADVAAYHPSDGSVWVGKNMGSRFAFTRYATVSPAEDWSFVGGQFAGDSLTDVAAYHPSDGSVWVGKNTGSRFAFTRYATVSPAEDWSFVAGQFAGDSLTDVAAYHPSDGSVWVGENTGSRFAFTRYATVSPAAGWSFAGGQFAGDSRADLAAYHPSDGSVWVGKNTGSRFAFTRYATVSPAEDWSFVAGQFAGDSRADLAAYHPSDGSVWVGKNTGSRFAFTNYATVSPAEDWSFVAGQFAGDSLTDVAAYHPSDGSVWVGENVEGVRRQLRISRFTTTNLSNTEADIILDDATAILQKVDGANDVACDVTMARKGAVTEFDAGDGSIDSEQEFYDIIALPGEVKVVNQINWCGGLKPAVVGCAPRPGDSLVVKRTTQEGIVWAHEFGHNQGLAHRSFPVYALMNGISNPLNRRINEDECQAFRADDTALFSGATVMSQLDEDSHHRDAQLLDVEDFVRQFFIQGIPYDQARQYDASAIPTLLEMLNDAAEEAYWTNIVVVLSIIGDDSAVEPLISFIEAGGEVEPLTPEHYDAKTSAIMSLGYLINKSGNQQALDYLKKSLAPQDWSARDVKGLAPFQESIAERNADFSKHAILGLSLSGHPEAAKALRSMQQPAKNAAQGAFQAQVVDLVFNALKENQKIANQGLADYYRSAQP